MEYVASLDLGSETIIMAVAEKKGEQIHVLGVESIVSEGISGSRIVDKIRVKAAVRQLLEVFARKYELRIDALHVSLSASYLRQASDHETITFSHLQLIEQEDLLNLRKKCRGIANRPEEPAVAILPYNYKLDRKECFNPEGQQGRRLEGDFRVYTARERDLAEIRELLAAVEVTQVAFFPAGEALMRAVSFREEGEFALIDLGAETTRVILVVDGLLEYDAELPLGGSAIDEDLNRAFEIHSLEKAKKLKHEYGTALRPECKKNKVIIPDTKFCIDSQNLALVEQCRLEEILEGAIYQLQQSGYYNTLEGGILLTGGGSRVRKITTLLEKLSGHYVAPAIPVGFTADRESMLKTPEFLTAIGLLRCGEEREEKKEGVFRFLKDIFKS